MACGLRGERRGNPGSVTLMGSISGRVPIRWPTFWRGRDDRRESLGPGCWDGGRWPDEPVWQWSGPMDDVEPRARSQGTRGAGAAATTTGRLPDKDTDGTTGRPGAARAGN